MIKVRLFGQARNMLGKDELYLKTKKIKVKDLLNELKKLSKSLEGFDNQRFLIMVNGCEISTLDGKDTMLKDGDEVAIISVVHGG
jgi:molybdopterin converting factor small subunit